MLFLISIIINVSIAETTALSADSLIGERNFQNTLAIGEVPSIKNIHEAQTETTSQVALPANEFGITTPLLSHYESVKLSNGQINILTDHNKIEYWKARFDIEWRRAKPFYESQLISNGPKPIRYYDFRVIDALTGILQATGDTKYLDNLVWYIDGVKNLAIKSSDGYFDWPNNDIKYQLYDGHGLRNVFKMLWILKKYPALRSKSNYQAKYDEWLAWFTTHVWDKWKSRGCGSILRSNTHMASHLGSNVALYLYLLEDDQTKKADYLSWLNAWNTDLKGKCRSAGKQGKGFRDQLRTTDYGGYIWASPWGQMEGSTDVSHANADVQSVINQFHQGIEWTETDIKKFIKTFNCILDASPNPDYANLPEFLDSIYNSDDDNRPSVSYGWSMLGRFDRKLHRKLHDINTRQFRATHYYNNFIAVMAYNQAYLDDALVYPEF